MPFGMLSHPWVNERKGKLLTLNTIVFLAEGGLVFQLGLVNDRVTDSSGPIRSEAVISRDPFGTDIGIDLYRMRFCVRRLSRYREV